MGKRPSHLLPFLSIAALLVFGSGCATFVKFSAEGTGAGNTFVRVNSTPQGITGNLETGRTFTTPVNLVLESDEEHTLTFTKEGAEPVVIHLAPSMNNWVWGNILTAGIGCLFDAEKGSNRTLSRDEIVVTFENVDAASEPEPEPATAGEGSSA